MCAVKNINTVNVHVSKNLLIHMRACRDIFYSRKQKTFMYCFLPYSAIRNIRIMRIDQTPCMCTCFTTSSTMSIQMQHTSPSTQLFLFLFLDTSPTRSHGSAHLPFFGRLLRNRQVSLILQSLKVLFRVCVANLIDLIKTSKIQSPVGVNRGSYVQTTGGNLSPFKIIH